MNAEPEEVSQKFMLITELERTQVDHTELEKTDLMWNHNMQQVVRVNERFISQPDKRMRQLLIITLIIVNTTLSTTTIIYTMLQYNTPP